MKTTRFFLVLLCIASMSACKSEEDIFVQSEINKVVGVWQITGFAVAGVPENLKNVLTNGTIRFANCTYSAKKFADGGLGCGGECQLGELFFKVGYSYNYEKKLFKEVYLAEKEEFRKNNEKYGDKSREITSLFDGDWDIAVENDKMTAKQVSNPQYPTAQISFVAIRKP